MTLQLWKPGRRVDVTAALARAADRLHWQQTYTEAQVGADYLARYGWFNLVSPDGPFLSDTLRLSVGYWGKGLVYPEHWHEPEETYVVLAGNAVFRSEHSGEVRLHPGDTRHHVSNEKHGMTMDQAPLLAAAVWSGRALTRKSVLGT